MKTETIAKNVTTLSEKSSAASDSGDAQRFAQAALNLAHVLATVDNLK